jgi:hypothetical protein
VWQHNRHRLPSITQIRTSIENIGVRLGIAKSGSMPNFNAESNGVPKPYRQPNDSGEWGSTQVGMGVDDQFYPNAEQGLLSPENETSYRPAIDTAGI